MRCAPFLLFLLLCVGCTKNSERAIPFDWQEFNGRDEIISYGQRVRRAVYHAKVPLSWKRIDAVEKESLLDTKKPIVSFKVDEKLFLTVHTFPTDAIEDRIPPAAQVERWRRQIEDPESTIKNIHHGGFAGLFFEGKNKEMTLCAWSMQLAVEHYQTLRFLAATVEEEEHYKQIAADYTIKVVGPTQVVEKHRDEITLFADSFELIQEIPAHT